MAKERNALKAGLFIILAVALAVGVLATLKSMLFESMQVRYVSFRLEDDIYGLNKGDDVRIGGFKVGEIREIELTNSNDPRLKTRSATAPATQPADVLLVTINIPKRYELRDGASPQLGSTLTGQAWLNFSSLGRGKVMGDGDVLAGRPSSFSEVMADLQEAAPRIRNIINQVDRTTIPTVNAALASVRDNTVPRVNNILDDVRAKTVPAFTATAETGTRLLNEIREQLKPVVEKYHKVADSGIAMMDEIKSMFGDTKGDFRTTMKNLATSSDAIKGKLPGILEKVDGVMAKIDTAVTSTNAALEDVKKIAANTRDMTAVGRSIMIGNKAKIDGMIASLKLTSDNLKNGSAEIRHSPWRLLYKPSPGEVSNLTLFDTARQFADGANDLNDAAQALRDVMKNNPQDEKEIKKLMERVERSFGNFSEVEQKLWKEVKP